MYSIITQSGEERIQCVVTYYTHTHAIVSIPLSRLIDHPPTNHAFTAATSAWRSSSSRRRRWRGSPARWASSTGPSGAGAFAFALGLPPSLRSLNHTIPRRHDGVPLPPFHTYTPTNSFVAEEDMGRVMAALAAICFDRWQRSHVDAVVHVRWCFDFGRLGWAWWLVGRSDGRGEEERLADPYIYEPTPPQCVTRDGIRVRCLLTLGFEVRPCTLVLLCTFVCVSTRHAHLAVAHIPLLIRTHTPHRCAHPRARAF